MKSHKMYFGFASALLLASASASAVGIASGSTSGTNFFMVEDIRNVCSTPQNPIYNVVTNGNLDNLFKVFSDPSTQYATTTADVLFYQNQQNAAMMKKISMVFPFFSTEIHIVVKANSPINSLQDLAGKRVIEGPDGSGTWVSSQVIKSVTGIQWNGSQATMSEGFNAVMNGQADAEVIVAGAPIDILKKSSGYRVIPIQHPQLDKFNFYQRTMIASGTYGNQQSIPTYSVDTILVTFAFKTQYQKEIGDLTRCIVDNIDRFQSGSDGKLKFHPKWRTVDPTDINRIKWQAHPAALKVINGK